MDIYADSLAAALAVTDTDIKQFQPQSRFEKHSGNKLLMRGLRYWHYPRVVRSSQADIHHVLDHGYAHLHPNFNDGKTCVTVHDLIPMLTWKGVIERHDTQGGSRKPWLNLKSLAFLKDFDKLISVSVSTKADLVEHLGLAESKIDVVPPVISSIFKPSLPDEIAAFARKYELDTQSKWLIISGSEYYKNHKTSLQVLKQLHAQNDLSVKLIKTGLPSAEFNRQVANLGLNSLVKNLFLEDFGELPLLYGFVDCVLFPSLYEGFGMPVAEALACGTPAVISNRASLPHVGGGLLPQYDPFDVEGLSQGVQLALSDEEFLSQINTTGPEHVKQYRASVVAEQLNLVYRSMV